jgi:hypothetical protein
MTQLHITTDLSEIHVPRVFQWLKILENKINLKMLKIGVDMRTRFYLHNMTIVGRPRD